MSIFYFAYGSNMNPRRMRQRGIAFIARLPAILRGYRLTFDKIPERGPEGSGYATLAADPGGVVEGVLYQVEDTDLGKLDVCEGYPEHYTRQTCKVALADGTLVNAVTYVANPRHVGEGLRPTREYLRHLWAGTDMVSESYRRMLRGITPYSGGGAGSGRDRQARRGGARRAQGGRVAKGGRAAKGARVPRNPAARRAG